jgi:hypothetical protein
MNDSVNDESMFICHRFASIKNEINIIRRRKDIPEILFLQSNILTNQKALAEWDNLQLHFQHILYIDQHIACRADLD